MRISISDSMFWLGRIAGLMIIMMALTSLVGLDETYSGFLSLISTIGLPFLAVYAVLTSALFASLVKMRQARRAESSQSMAYWAQIGTQLCGLLSTTALVFTLFGLSQGVLLLGVSEVTPDSIDQLLGELMTHFGVAFYSSIIGLPTAAVGRFIVFTTCARPAKIQKETPYAISL